jgi:hypothetical protein
MEVIYTGREKNLHYILAKRIIKDRKINTDDIATITFKNAMPTEQMPLWTFMVIIEGAGGYKEILGEEKFYLKNCTKHGFSVTWANLKKGNF